MKILVTEPISPAGLSILRAEAGWVVETAEGLAPSDLASRLETADALIVRSGTKVSKDLLAAAKRLRVIGRAGTGVDNIDLAEATRRGILVLAAPGGNAHSTADLTIGLLLAVLRRIPAGTRALAEGNWAERKKLVGWELAGKTLGVVGLGRIGSEVVRRAKAFGMKVVAYDPYARPETAVELGIELVPLETLLGRADVITVHAPATAETKRLLSDEAFRRMKKGVFVLNCARGGIVDEAALLRALEDGTVAGAGLDVFEKEPPPDDHPLLRHRKVVATPHLGASTEEAQEKVGVEIATSVRDFLRDRVVRASANYPSLTLEQAREVGPWLDLAERMGSLVSQIASRRVRGVEVVLAGEVSALETRPIVASALKGALTPILGDTVNVVNAAAQAESRGIDVRESRVLKIEDYLGLVGVRLSLDGGEAAVEGTIFHRGQGRVVSVDGVPIEFEPKGHLLFTRNEDAPGVIGAVGTALGRAGVNIASLSLGRDPARRCAVGVYTVDSAPVGSVLAALTGLPHVLEARAIHLP